MKKKIVLAYKEYENKSQLSEQKQVLLEKALSATQLAYAPYSQFKVGSAILLEDGEVICGANIENASFPAGICAERAALSSVSALAPNKKIKAIAVSYVNENGKNNAIISPCGVCRQVISEYEHRQNMPIEILLFSSLPDSRVIEIPSIEVLLPFSFTKDNLG